MTWAVLLFVSRQDAALRMLNKIRADLPKFAYYDAIDCGRLILYEKSLLVRFLARIDQLNFEYVLAGTDFPFGNLMPGCLSSQVAPSTERIVFLFTIIFHERAEGFGRHVRMNVESFSERN